MAVAAAVVVLAASCNSGSKVKGIEAQLPTKAETDSVSYLIGIQFGYFIRANNFAGKLNELNFSQIKKGMVDFVNADGNIQDADFNKQFKISPDQMNELFNNYITKRNAYKAEVNGKLGEEFLDANKLKDNVVVTESGLQYIILEDGNDVKPGPKDTVWVQYTGTLLDGTQFDASNKDNDPVRMYMNRVIKGWTEGLQLIGEGGHIQLFIPADLAYGSRGNQGIEPNSTLIFDIELSKVGHFVEKPVEPKTPTKKK